jgi:O-antigen ligase
MSRAEKVLWIFFAGTSAQLTFHNPYLILVPGERTNLLAGLLCLLTLLAVLIWGRKEALKLKSPEFLVSGVLLVLAVVSAWLNGFAASCRVFALLASGLGGFWTARILLDTPANQRRFEWLGLLLLTGLIPVSLASFFFTHDIGKVLNFNSHPLTDTIVLLSFGPLVFLAGGSRPLKCWAIITLGAGYLVLLLSKVVSAVVIPLAALLAVGIFFREVRPKHLILALLAGLLLIGLCFHKILWVKLTVSKMPYYLAYRLENYPFAWHVAKQHPIFGIGLRTPREEYLQDYRLRFPYYGEGKFPKKLHTDVSADNTFLTFVTGLGFPFVIIYGLALMGLFGKLIRLTWRPPPAPSLPPLALLLPLAMALAHFQVYDGLLYPQNCWFFHLLLGLIPWRGQSLGAASPGAPAPVWGPGTAEG